MIQKFNCPSCNEEITAKAQVGAEIRCLLCGELVRVPEVQAPPSGPDPAAQPFEIKFEAPAPLDDATDPSSTLGTGSMLVGLLGLASFCPFASLPALVMGIVALRRIKKQPKRYEGKRGAVIGCWTGAAGLVLSSIVWPLFYPVLSGELGVVMEMRRRDSCAAAMKRIATAMFFYAQDGGDFPDTLDALSYYTELGPEDLVCPADETEGPSYICVPGYGLLDDEEQIILFEVAGYHGGGGHILTIGNKILFLDSPEFEERIAGIKLPDGSPFFAGDN